MKKAFLQLVLLLIILSGCSSESPQPETFAVLTETTAAAVETEPSAATTEPETTAPPPVPVVVLTEEEATMLLKIGMAELGHGDCTECIALVMRTVLNRVEAPGFGSSIRSVLFAQDQFTPVMDGSYEKSEPNERCYEALEMIVYGWDESPGALYYEFCEGESWHSKNLHLLFQHCDTRFYD